MTDVMAPKRGSQFLLFTQFGVAGLLIILGLFGQAQLSHLNTLDRGYDPEGIYVIRAQALSERARQTIAQDMARMRSIYRGMEDVDAVAATFTDPVNNVVGGVVYSVEGVNKPGAILGPSIEADGSYLQVYGIPMIAGRGPAEFQPMDMAALRSTDKPGIQEVTITRSALNRLGFNSPEEVIGRRLMSGQGGTSNAYYQIVGVSEDMWIGSSSNMHKAGMFSASFWRPRVISLRVSPHLSNDMMQRIHEIWRREMLHVHASVEYMPELIRRSSEPLQRMTQLFWLASLLAVVIAGLGLYSTSLFAVQRRTKEVGIRKVLGASVPSVVLELSRSMLIPVALAAVAAVPVSYLAVTYLLQNFSVQVATGPLWFCVGVALLLVIAGITVSTHVWRSARTNPVASLRYE